MRWVLAGVLCIAGCAGVESDIKRAGMREFFLDFVYGKDRGAGYYARQIEKSTTKPQGGRYQYVAPAHVSHYLINKSTQGLGGTELENSDYLAYATDRLFYVLKHDPTASVRATAVQSLGRIVLKLPVSAQAPAPSDNRADTRINTIAQDLVKYADDVAKGEQVTQEQVVERLEALAKERPPTWRSAMQMVRALAAAPVAGVTEGPIREMSEALAPELVRDCILVALREVSMGDPIREELEPDEAELVRADAIDVLTRVASPVGLDGAEHRLAELLDPLERNPDVRGKLCTYLGALGGARAFEQCVRRLDDVDAGVRYHAYGALLRMTNARIRPNAAAWRAWQAERPAWQVPKKDESKDE